MNDSITFQGFVDYLYSRKGTTIMTIETETVPDMIMRGNPYKGHIVTKKAKTSIQTGFDWENAVNNQLVKQDKNPDFVMGERQWGTVDDKRSFVTNKGVLYIRARVLQSLSYEYFVDGKPVSKEEINPWLRPRKSEPAITRNWKMENIKVINVAGQTLQLEPSTFQLPE